MLFGSKPVPLMVTVVRVVLLHMGNIEFVYRSSSLRVTVGYDTLHMVYHRDPLTFNPIISALAMSAKAGSPLSYLLLLNTGNSE
jgi:hypothetical protein